MTLKVKPEYAGRSSKCPTCKQPLVVPQPEITEAYVPKDQIDGTQSSLDQVGINGEVNLEEGRKVGQKSVGELLAKRQKNGGRYVLAGEIVLAVRSPRGFA